MGIVPCRFANRLHMKLPPVSVYVNMSGTYTRSCTCAYMHLHILVADFVCWQPLVSGRLQCRNWLELLTTISATSATVHVMLWLSEVATVSGISSLSTRACLGWGCTDTSESCGLVLFWLLVLVLAQRLSVFCNALTDDITCALRQLSFSSSLNIYWRVLWHSIHRTAFESCSISRSSASPVTVTSTCLASSHPSLLSFLRFLLSILMVQRHKQHFRLEVLITAAFAGCY